MIKTPGGDNLSQIPNLLDLFKNGKEAAANGPSEARQAAPRKDMFSTLVDATKTQTSAGESVEQARSFQARVEESRAKLEAAKKPSEPKPAESEARPAPKADRTDRPQPRDDRRDRPEAAKGDDRDREDDQDGKAEGTRDGKAMRNTHVTRGSKGGHKRSKGDAGGKNPSAQIDDGKLKKMLADQGIQVTDAQLNDPAFLAKLLQSLQAAAGQNAPALAADAQTQSQGGPQAAALVNTQVTPAADANAVAANLATVNTDAANAAPGAANGDKGAAAAQTAQPAQVALEDLFKDGQGADKNANALKAPDAKELASLIEGKLAQIQQAAHPGTQSGIEPSGARVAAAATPAAWQGIEVRPRAESVSTEPMPMGDLDRMRVMQAAALQAGGTKPAQNLVHADDGDAHLDAVDGAREASAQTGDAVAVDPKDAGAQNNEADLFGRNENPSGSADAAMPRAGASVAREGAAGLQFNQTLDQIRNADNRASIQRDWTPLRSPVETGILDQISKKLSASALKSGDELTVQLSPEHLGKVKVELEMKDGAMSAHIGVENEDVKKTIEANLGNLRDSLESQGLKLTGLEVSVDQRQQGSLFNPDGSNSQSFFSRQGRGASGSDGSGVETAPFEPVPESDTGRRWGYNTREYIG